MGTFVEGMTFKELKEAVARLEQTEAITDETKIFLDTGWDSLQEVMPGVIKTATAKAFQVADPLTGENFGGYSLLEKADKTKADGEEETVIVIENHY